MRILYKALASVGMIALSTAAAFGVRHLTIVSKKRKQNDASKDVNQSEVVESEKIDQSAESADNEAVQEDSQALSDAAVETPCSDGDAENSFSDDAASESENVEPQDSGV